MDYAADNVHSTQGPGLSGTITRISIMSFYVRSRMYADVKRHVSGVDWSR